MPAAMNLQSGDIIACAAAVIALCSFGATIWQGRLTRGHNRLSVTPLLVWSRGRSWSDHSVTCSFSIKNVGIGPAIVKRQRCIYQDEEIELRGDDVIRQLIGRMLGDCFPYVLRRHGLPGIGTAIPPGKECIIASIEFESLSEEQLNLVEKFLVIEYSLEYESLYGDKKMLKN